MTYQITNDSINLPCKSGETLSLRLTATSGRIVYRNKIDTIIGIKHPGIELGVDHYGNRWIAHHHFENNFPAIESEEKFSKGVGIFYDSRPVFYDQYEIIERALYFWWNGQEYHWLRQNCQHYVNAVAQNQHKSDAIEEISDFTMFLGAASTLAGLLTGNKTLVNVGLGVAATGGIAKVVSRQQSNPSLPSISLKF